MKLNPDARGSYVVASSTEVDGYIKPNALVVEVCGVSSFCSVTVGYIKPNAEG